MLFKVTEVELVIVSPQFIVKDHQEGAALS